MFASPSLALALLSEDGNADPSLGLPEAQPATFLGFPDKLAFHRFSGWAGGASLLAAGLAGGAHFLDLMNRAHRYRDAHGIEEFDPQVCPGEIEYVWASSSGQALRWTHVGLLALGEVFYTANAVTGTSFMGPLGEGWSAAKIHRYAFFAHCGLMACEAVLGFFMTDALERGDHEAIQILGASHAAIGIVIPVIILGAGAIMDR